MPEKPHFQISSEVVRQLGEQLISDEVTALLELVKNSYDADASYVKVIINTKKKFKVEDHFPNLSNDAGIEDADEPGYIIIEDNGFGMDEDDIRDGWLTISVSKKRGMKESGEVTPKKERTPLGDKGLGRLSTQRLGNILTMSSVKEYFDEDGNTISISDSTDFVSIDWRKFKEDVLLRNVPVDIHSFPAQKKKQGTKLVISSLHDLSFWEDQDTQSSLINKFSQLISPFEEVRPFKIHFDINGSKIELERISQNIRDLAQSTHRFIFDGKQINIEGKYKLTTLRGDDDVQIYRKAVGNDQGKDFFEFLQNSKRGKSIDGLEYRNESNWFISYKKTIEVSELGGINRIKNNLANPGPFNGIIEQFSYDKVIKGSVKNIFDKVSNFRSYVKSQAGIKLYRDGFGVRPYGFDNEDWLNLSKSMTSGGSYYELRPSNVVGYVSISAKENNQLKEKTDREGFVDDHYSKNFILFMNKVIDIINTNNENIRRAYNNYKREIAEELIGFSSPDKLFKSMRSVAKSVKKGNIDEITSKISDSSQSIESIHKQVKTNQDLQESGKEKLEELLKESKNELNKAYDTLKEAEEFKKNISELKHYADSLEDEFAVLQEQKEDFAELAGLGITAEALSHELANIADLLSSKTKNLINFLNKQDIRVSEITTYTEYVKSSVSSIRKQLSHLSPSLRYVREEKNEISSISLLNELQEYYNNLNRFSEANIEVVITKQSEDFDFYINKGKITQVIDNLVINSEYWLKEYSKSDKNFKPKIFFESTSPYLRIFDNGPGIASNVASNLFEPFVTNKPRGKGRGLGLYITQQLLDSNNCEIYLLPEKNEHDKPFKFEIDLTGTLHND